MDFCLGVNGLEANPLGGLTTGNRYYKAPSTLEFESGVFL